MAEIRKVVRELSTILPNGDVQISELGSHDNYILVDDGSLTLADKLDGLDNIPTVMQADPNNFSVVHIDIVDGGTGYLTGEEVTINDVPCVVDQEIDGCIVSISFDHTAAYSIDPAGTGFTVDHDGGGTPAIANIITRYAVGNEVVIGELASVPEEDPLVQSSRMRGWVNDQNFANKTYVLEHSVKKYVIPIENGVSHAGILTVTISNYSGDPGYFVFIYDYGTFMDGDGNLQFDYQVRSDYVTSSFDITVQ